MVWTPATGIVHRSHRAPVIGSPVVKEAAGGTIAEAWVEYDTCIVTPSVDPQSNGARLASGMKSVPTGIASVTTNVNADAEE